MTELKSLNKMKVTDLLFNYNDQLEQMIEKVDKNKITVIEEEQCTLQQVIETFAFWEMIQDLQKEESMITKMKMVDGQLCVQCPIQVRFPLKFYLFKNQEQNDEYFIRQTIIISSK